MFATNLRPSSCMAARAVALLTLLFAGAAPVAADENTLLMEQIGDNNRAISYQGSVPTSGQLENALETSPNVPLFDVLASGTLVESNNFRLSSNQSIGDLLAPFQGLSGGNRNVSEVRQSGSRNKALSLQVDGSNNQLLTEQDGNDNIGVHLQRGSSNDTELVQIGNGNKNALIAEGGAVGDDGPLRLQAEGGVKGFSIRADGLQGFSTVTVQPNHTGGLNVALQ